jgi:hypothetical protein
VIVAGLFLQVGATNAADYPPNPGSSLSPAPVATTPASVPTPQAQQSPISLPPVTAPLQVAVVRPNEQPASPSLPVTATSISQVAIDGKYVNIVIAQQKNPAPGTVGVAILGDGFNFSLSTTSEDGKTTVGSVSIINGQPVVNIPQNTTIATTGTGFRPNDQVSLYVFSVGKFLGNINTSAIGEINVTVKLPNLPLGPHHFQASGLTKDGKTRTITLFMNLTPASLAKPGVQPKPTSSIRPKPTSSIRPKPTSSSSAAPSATPAPTPTAVSVAWEKGFPLRWIILILLVPAFIWFILLRRRRKEEEETPQEKTKRLLDERERGKSRE